MKRYDHPFTHPHNFIQASGETVRDTYILDISPEGEKKLICSGSVDIKEKINSYRDVCDLKSILERHDMMGTLSSLAQNEGGVVDLSRFPTNLHEMRSMLNNVDTIYQNLAPEVKAHYENLEEFLSVFGSVGALRTFLLQNGQRKLHSEKQKQEVKEGD